MLGPPARCSPAIAAALLTIAFAAPPARADDHPSVRLGLAVAPAAVGIFNVGTDGHSGTSLTAFGGRVGVMYAPSRYFQVGIDGMVLAPYGGVVVHYATQLAMRGALPLGDSFELGLTARLGPGFARVESGIAYRTSTNPYSSGPAVNYFGWQAGVALDATLWLNGTVALVFAVEAITGSKTSTAGDDVYLGYLSKDAGPAAIAPWLGVQIGR